MLRNKIFKNLPISTVIIFCSFLIATNFLVQWQIHFYNFTLTVGLFVYPILFLLTDYTTEIYGRSNSKRLAMLGLIFSIIPSIFISTFQIILGSLLAYLVAQLMDIYSFLWIKDYTHGKYLWLRSSMSTAVSLLADTFIFSFVAFYGVLDNKTIISIMYTEYPIKLAYAFLNVIPLYYFVNKYRRHGK